VLAVREVDVPQPGPGEVLVRVRAAALNPKDVFTRRGSFRLLSGGRFPKIVGLDFAGEIVGLGRGTHGYHQGDRVFGFLSHWSAIRGTVAEYVSAPTRHLAAMPRGCPFEDSCRHLALPVAYLHVHELALEREEVSDPDPVKLGPRPRSRG